MQKITTYIERKDKISSNKKQLAQLVECFAYNENVNGSSPLLFIFLLFKSLYRLIGQDVVLSKQKYGFKSH